MPCIRRTAVSASWRQYMLDDSFPADYLSAIGEVNVRWNDLEFLITLSMILLLGQDIYDEKAYIVFAHMTFPQKLDVLGALAEQMMNKRGYSRFKKFKSHVLPLLKKAQQGRNSIIHSDWTSRSGTMVKTSISARGSFKFSSEVVALKEILAVNQSIEEARMGLFDFVNPMWTRARRREARGRKLGNN